MGEAWFDAIDVVRQSQQEVLEALGSQGPARNSRRQLALDRQEDALHERPIAIQVLEEIGAHLGADTASSLIAKHVAACIHRNAHAGE